MNDLGYGQLSNLNQSHKLVLSVKEIIRNSFNISTILGKDFIVSHSLSLSPLILRVNNLILATQSSSRTSCYIIYDFSEISRLAIRKS